MMSIAKVAEVAGVSPSTVARVINGKAGIKADTLQTARDAFATLNGLFAT